VAERVLERYKDEKLEVGDKVRIKLAAIDTRVRKEIKAGNEKLLVVRYTPEIYTVNRVYNPKPNTLQKPQYGTNFSAKRFWASELQKVEGDAEDSNVNADKLNRL
jgi:hypothetical protein